MYIQLCSQCIIRGTGKIKYKASSNLSFVTTADAGFVSATFFIIQEKYDISTDKYQKPEVLLSHPMTKLSSFLISRFALNEDIELDFDNSENDILTIMIFADSGRVTDINHYTNSDFGMQYDSAPITEGVFLDNKNTVLKAIMDFSTKEKTGKLSFIDVRDIGLLESGAGFYSI